MPVNREKRTVNYTLLAVTLVFVPAIAFGAYYLRQQQMPRIASQFLRLADAKEQQAEEATDPLKQSALYQQAAAFVFRYVEITGRDIAEEVRMLDLWEKHTDLIPVQSPSYISAMTRSLELHQRVLGGVENTPELQDHLAPLRIRLLELTDQQYRLITQREQAEALLIHDKLLADRKADPSQKVNQEDIRKAARERLESLTETNILEMTARNEHFPFALSHLSRAMWQMLENNSLPADETQQFVCRVIQLAALANPDDRALTVQYALFLREHPNLLTMDLKKRYGADRDREAFADSLLDDLIAKNRTAENLLTRAQYRTRYELEGADEDVQAALELQDANAFVYRYAARTFLSEGLRLGAEDQKRAFLLASAADKYERLQELEGTEESYWGRADALIGLEEFEQATKACLAGYEKYPNGREILSRLAKVCVIKEDFANAEKWLAEIAKKQVEEWKAPSKVHQRLNAEVELVKATYQLGLARQLMADGKQDNAGVQEAVRILQPLASNAESSNFRLGARKLLGEAYELLGLWDQAAQAFESAAADAPADYSLRARAGNNRVRAGHLQEGAAHFESILAQQIGSVEVLEAFAGVQLQIQAFSPRDSRNWSNFDQAVDNLEKMIDVEESDRPWSPQILRIRKHYVDNERAEAVKLLDDVVSEYRDEPSCQEVAASLYVSLERPDLARDLLDHGQVQTTGSLEQDGIRARIRMDDGDYAGAVAILERLLQSAKPEKHNGIRLGIAQVYLAAGDVDNAIASLNQLTNVMPDQLDEIVMFVDSIIAISPKGVPLASRWAEEARRIEGPESTYASFLRCRSQLSQVHTSKEEVEATLELVRNELPNLANRPDWAGYHLVRSMLARFEGKALEATQSLEAAVELGDRRTWVVSDLISMYQQQGQIEKARDLLQRVSKLHKLSGRLSSLAIMLTPNVNDRERIARAGLKQRPDDPLAHLWLGNILSAKEEEESDEEAYTHLRRATELAPKQLRTWNSLFTHLINRKQMEEAKTVLAEMAETVAKSEAERHFLLAQGYEYTNPEIAKATYDKALATRNAKDKQNIVIAAGCATYYVRTGNTAAAKDLFSEVLVLAEKSGQKTLANSARRALAALAAAEGGEHWLAEAQEYLKEATDENDPTSDVLNAQIEAVLCIQRNQLQDGQVILEDLMKRPAFNAVSAFLLAQLYILQHGNEVDEERANEKLVKARDLLEEVCIATGNSNHRIRLVGLLHKMGELDEADRHLNRLESEEKYKPQVALGRAKWHQLKGHDRSQIVEAAKKYVEAQGEFQSQKQERDVCSNAGKILSGFGLHDEAATYLQRAFDLDPDRFIPLIANYAERGKVEEAIQLAKQRSPSTGHALIAITGVLSSGKATKEQLEQLRPDVEKALDEKGESRRIRVAAGIYYMALGELEVAAKHYEHVVRTNDTDLIALNNLALILSEDVGQLDTAMNHIQLAIDEYGNLPALLDTQAMIHLRNNNASQAVRQLRLANNLEIFPNPTHQFHLAVSLAKTGNTDEARRIYQSAKQQGLEGKLWTDSEKEMAAELEELLQEQEQEQESKEQP